MEKSNDQTYRNNLEGASAGVGRVTGKNLPMVEHALWEGLSSGVGSEIGGETERFVYRQVSLDHEHGGTGDLQFFENVTTSAIEDSVDSTNGYFGALEDEKFRLKIVPASRQTKVKVKLENFSWPFLKIVHYFCQNRSVIRTIIMWNY